jgi:hypothetical protein
MWMVDVLVEILEVWLKFSYLVVTVVLELSWLRPWMWV